MNVKLLLFSLLMVFTRANAQKKEKLFNLSGRVLGRDAGIVWISYVNWRGERIRDTAYLKNGYFSYMGFISEPTNAVILGNTKSRLMGDPNITSFFLEPGKIKIVLKDNDFVNAKVKGSRTEQQSSELKEIKKGVLSSITLIYEEQSKIEQLIKKGDTSVITCKKLVDIEHQLAVLHNREKQIDIKYIESNPTSFLSPDLLSMYVNWRQISLDSADLLFEKMPRLVRISRTGKVLSAVLSSRRSSMIGEIAPLFKVKDIFGGEIDLNSYKGNSYVLLEFWASWCKPCWDLNPYIKMLYEKYGDKGLKIIGISLDSNELDWRNAIERYNQNKWINLYVGGISNNKNIKSEYDVGGIPIAILIDKKGTIIGRFLGKEIDSEKELLSNKLEQIFK